MYEYSKVNSPGYKVVYAVLLIYDLMTFVITRVYPPSRAASRHVELVLRLQLSVSLQSFCLQAGFQHTRLLSSVQSDAAHSLGVCHRVHLLNWMVSWVEEIEARSCDAVHVADSTLGGVPARVFHPVGGAHLKRGIVYFHGGGWALCSARESDFSYRLVKQKVSVKPDDLYLQGCAHTTFCVGKWRRSWTPW